LYSYGRGWRSWFIELINSPEDSNPRISDGIGRFKAGQVGKVRTRVRGNSIVQFGDSFSIEGNGAAPEEVFKVKRTGGDASTFV
jgi:hypothetical protein